jgi:hypothetical protein
MEQMIESLIAAIWGLNALIRNNKTKKDANLKEMRQEMRAKLDAHHEEMRAEMKAGH